MKLKYFIATLACMSFVWGLQSCISDGEDTIVLEDGNNTDIPSDSKADPNPELTEEPTAVMPNIQYSIVDEDGSVVFRIDMTGIQDKSTLEWIHLYGTGEKNQNVWVEVDDTPKGIKVYNTADDEDVHTVPVDLVFLVDNSGSMSEEADVIARDITEWSQKLEATGLSIRFGCVGFDGSINGAINLTTVENLSTWLDRSTGTKRTVGFDGSDATKLSNSAADYRTGGNSSNECGVAAARFANDLFSFRSSANRIYVNFTDEPNQPSGKSAFSVEWIKNNWETSMGTIHTVFSNVKETQEEFNYLMSEYTGGTVINTNSSFTGVSLESLPVSDAMQNSYIIRLTNVREYMDGNTHKVHITVLSADNSVRVERTYYVIFASADD
jgi:hypothetical protein